jgi:hypothetical protein
MAETETRRSGGCLCGALRYELEGEPLYMGHCYCEDCRKASGSGFIPFMGYASGKVRFSGEPRTFRSKAANGNVAARNFCSLCGGLVFGGEIGKTESFTIYAGSLDDPTPFSPTVAIFVRGRPDWAVIPKGIEQFDGLPP